MLPKKESLKRLQTFFRKNRIAEMTELFTLLETHSRMSVFRRLTELGYLSSYTHAGKYYTLSHIPHFDSEGLWNYDGIGFSKSGSLKETITHLINQSEVGMTHKELENRLWIPVYNTLLDLVKASIIERVQLNDVYLYVNRDSERSYQQLTHRQAFKMGWNKTSTLPDWLVIEVLVEVIRTGKSCINTTQIVSKLMIRGIAITDVQVEQVFQLHNIKKKLGILCG